MAMVVGTVTMSNIVERRSADAESASTSDLESEIFHFGSSCKSLSLNARAKWYLTSHPIGPEPPKAHLPTRKNRPCAMARSVFLVSVY